MKCVLLKVSFSGLAMAVVAARLMISEQLFYRRCGALLFEARNLADSLDGIVYRSRKRDQEYFASLVTVSPAGGESGVKGPQLGVYQSNYGTSGYNVDALSDGFGGILFMIALFVRFLRHPPAKSKRKFLFKHLITFSYYRLSVFFFYHEAVLLP